MGEFPFFFVRLEIRSTLIGRSGYSANPYPAAAPRWKGSGNPLRIWEVCALQARLEPGTARTCRAGEARNRRARGWQRPDQPRAGSSAHGGNQVIQPDTTSLTLDTLVVADSVGYGRVVRPIFLLVFVVNRCLELGPCRVTTAVKAHCNHAIASAARAKTGTLLDIQGESGAVRLSLLHAAPPNGILISRRGAAVGRCMA